jgi:gamma-glutamylcyclotransferase (GGCT)/AIG2-like uncharacterized protein YtfP
MDSLIKLLSEFFTRYIASLHDEQAAMAKHLRSIAQCLKELASELRSDNPTEIARLRIRLASYAHRLLAVLPEHPELDQSGDHGKLLRAVEDLARRTSLEEWRTMAPGEKIAILDGIISCEHMILVAAEFCEDPVGTQSSRLFRTKPAKATVPEKTTVLAVSFQPPRETGVRRFLSASPQSFNEEFYTYFIETIDRARSELYITGSGFDCLIPRGFEIAEAMCRGMRRALERGVSIVRVQSTSTVSMHYVSMLGALLDDWPHQFRLFLRDASDAADWCVIDPQLRDQCVVEWSSSSIVRFGSKEANLASTAFFDCNNPEFAQTIHAKITELTKPPLSTRIETAKMLEERTRSRELYFAYGSNMSRTQMKTRVPNAIFIGIGTIDGYTLTFNRKGSYRPGGVASIVAAKGERVYGVVWEISSDELRRLDIEEDPAAYARHPMAVALETDIAYMCHVYVAYPQGDVAPDPHYLELIISAAREVGLPADYVEKLCRWRDRLA